MWVRRPRTAWSGALRLDDDRVRQVVVVNDEIRPELLGLAVEVGPLSRGVTVDLLDPPGGPGRPARLHRVAHRPSRMPTRPSTSRQCRRCRREEPLPAFLSSDTCYATQLIRCWRWGVEIGFGLPSRPSRHQDHDALRPHRLVQQFPRGGFTGAGEKWGLESSRSRLVIPGSDGPAGHRRVEHYGRSRRGVGRRHRGAPRGGTGRARLGR